MRVAARSNDSRELQEGLEGILKVVAIYAPILQECGSSLSAVPSVYRSYGDDRRLNPLIPLPDVGRSDRLQADSTSIPQLPQVDDWLRWAPPKIVTPPPTKSDDSARWNRTIKDLSGTWFANEIGRAVVRAVELGVQTNALLDRDTFRLLNTLVNATFLFCNISPDETSACDWSGRNMHEAAEWSAGVQLRYLMEIGLGARDADESRVEWHMEPLIRLARLHRTFFELERTTASERARRLRIGAGAGVVLLVATIRLRQTGLKEASADTLTTSDSEPRQRLRRSIGALLHRCRCERSRDDKAIATQPVASEPSPNRRPTLSMLDEDPLKALKMEIMSPVGPYKEIRDLIESRILEPDEQLRLHLFDPGGVLDRTLKDLTIATK